MMLNHLWGLYSHPQDEWRSINANRESLLYSVSHILIIALVPTICSFFSAVYLGWYLSLGPTAKVPILSAVGACLVFYSLLVGGVFLLSLMAWRMAQLFGASTSYIHSVELAAYAATPLFMAGFCALYPEPWFIVTCGAAGLGYSAYLLYSGVQILIDIEPQKRRTFWLALLACALILLFSLLGVMVWVWSE